MQAERYRRMMEVFEQVCDLDPAERSARVAALCGQDAELRTAVQALIAEDDRSSVFLDGGAAELAAATADEVPERLGDYEIVGVLGTGGMGAVYEARQEEPARVVALKTIHPWLVNPRMLERFLFEADALARLTHPGIPAIYAVGREEGRVWLAMELVRGAPLTTWAAERSLSLRERLELLAATCDAVHHAHLRGLLHRDLKPGNILVTDEGQPKVLDFGLARALDPMARGALEPELAGTIAYMSPEQLRGDPALDLRADVYALGRTLYELLAGRPAVTLSGFTLEGAISHLLEHRPPPLQGVPADVASIVERAMASDPADRYPSAADLAEDLRRFLDSRPVLAHRGGPLYRADKLMRRHTRELALAAALLLTLVTGLVATAHSRDVARAEATKSASVTRFLSDLLQQAHPRLAKGDEVTVRAALHDAVRRLDAGELADEPDVEFALRDTIGSTLWALGDQKQALDQLAAMEELYASGRVTEGEAAAKLFQALGEVAYANQELEDALRHGEQAERLERGLHGGTHSHVAIALHNQGVALHGLGRLDEAAEHLAGAVELREALGDPREPGATTLASSLSWLAIVRMDQGRRDEARPLYERALQVDRAALGDDHPDVAVRLHHLASYHQKAGEPAKALELLDEAASIRARTLSPDHPRLADQHILHALLYRDLGRHDEAVATIQRAVDLLGATYGAEDPRTKHAANLLAELSK